MNSVKIVLQWVLATAILVSFFFVFRGSTNNFVYWIAFLPVKIIQIIVLWQQLPQGAVELTSLTLGAPLTVYYWYLGLFVFQKDKT